MTILRADAAARRYYYEYPATEDTDGGDIAERAFEHGYKHFDFLRKSRYILTASWHVVLFEAFEQQIRGFLFDEVGHREGMNFKDFCTSVAEICNVFRDHDVDVQELSSWSKISEMNSVCNVIKHGDGYSASKLREENPSLFRTEDEIDSIDLHRTTLLEETLQIDAATLENYKDALLKFWDDLPERSYSC